MLKGATEQLAVMGNTIRLQRKRHKITVVAAAELPIVKFRLSSPVKT